ncbi:MAG: LysR substrate-binding domain-containing protein [Salibacteraceae bacterium]
MNYLIALDRYQNFSKAAEHTYVSQPTLSMQVKKLENDLGVTIIDRSKQPLKFTAIGEEILKQAKLALTELRMIDNLVAESKGELSGDLLVGVIPTIAPYLVPLFLGSFLKQYPKINLKLSEYKTDEIINKLERDELDVGLLSTPLKRSSIIEEPLFYEKLLSYTDDKVNEAYGNRISIDDILKYKLWVLSEGNCFRNQSFNLCEVDQTQHRSLELTYESGSIETLIRLVDREGGTTIIPELALDTLSSQQIDHVKFIGEENPVREISTVSRRRGLKVKMIKVLRSTIKESLPKNVLENLEEKSVVEI